MLGWLALGVLIQLLQLVNLVPALPGPLEANKSGAVLWSFAFVFFVEVLGLWALFGWLCSSIGIGSISFSSTFTFAHNSLWH